jgi:beta-lactam-binding protein with PASTA domain
VVTDQSPAAYLNVAPNTTVTLKVSTGKKVLPSVVGLTFDQAQAKLNGAGFTNITIPAPTTTTTDQSKDGKVASQNPAANIAYPLDTQITLVVYQYQAPSSSASSSASSSSSSSTSSGPPGPGG